MTDEIPANLYSVSGREPALGGSQKDRKNGEERPDYSPRLAGAQALSECIQYILDPKADLNHRRNAASTLANTLKSGDPIIEEDRARIFDTTLSAVSENLTPLTEEEAFSTQIIFRVRCLNILANYSDPRAIPAIVSNIFLKVENSRMEAISRAALKAGKYYGPQILEEIIDRTDKEDILNYHITYELAYLMKALGRESLSCLYRMLDTGQPLQMKSQAFHVLLYDFSPTERGYLASTVEDEAFKDEAFARGEKPFVDADDQLLEFIYQNYVMSRGILGEFRAAAIMVLGRHRFIQAVPGLMNIIESVPDEEMYVYRSYAVAALGDMRSTSSVSFLHLQLERELELERRAWADGYNSDVPSTDSFIKSLGKIASRESVPFLEGILSKRHYPYLYSHVDCIDALARIGGDEAYNALLTCPLTDSSQVRRLTEALYYIRRGQSFPDIFEKMGVDEIGSIRLSLSNFDRQELVRELESYQDTKYSKISALLKHIIENQSQS